MVQLIVAGRTTERVESHLPFHFCGSFLKPYIENKKKKTNHNEEREVRNS